MNRSGCEIWNFNRHAKCKMSAGQWSVRFRASNVFILCVSIKLILYKRWYLHDFERQIYRINKRNIVSDGVILLLGPDCKHYAMNQLIKRNDDHTTSLSQVREKATGVQSQTVQLYTHSTVLHTIVFIFTIGAWESDFSIVYHRVNTLNHTCGTFI